jgi:hypothetical protein
MLIRSKIERKGGTFVTLDKTEYHFKPAKAGDPHIATVEDQAHIARFLSITEGYQFHGVSDGDGDDDKASAPITSSVKVDTPETLAVKAISAVMADPLGIDDDTLSSAFQFLNGRAPNAKAKRITIIDRIVTKAAEQGLIKHSEAADALDALRPAEPEPAQEQVPAGKTATTIAGDKIAPDAKKGE